MGSKNEEFNKEEKGKIEKYILDIMQDKANDHRAKMYRTDEYLIIVYWDFKYWSFKWIYLIDVEKISNKKVIKIINEGELI